MVTWQWTKQTINLYARTSHFCFMSSLSIVIPNFFGTRDQFCWRQLSHRQGWQLGWFRGIVFIEHHHLRSTGNKFSYGVHILDLVYAQFTAGYKLQESNAATLLIGGGAQTVRKAMGSSCKYRWSFACWPTAHLLLCSPNFKQARDWY